MWHFVSSWHIDSRLFCLDWHLTNKSTGGTLRVELTSNVFSFDVSLNVPCQIFIQKLRRIRIQLDLTLHCHCLVSNSELNRQTLRFAARTKQFSRAPRAVRSACAWCIGWCIGYIEVYSSVLVTLRFTHWGLLSLHGNVFTLANATLPSYFHVAEVIKSDALQEMLWSDLAEGDYSEEWHVGTVFCCRRLYQRFFFWIPCMMTHVC